MTLQTNIEIVIIFTNHTVVYLTFYKWQSHHSHFTIKPHTLLSIWIYYFIRFHYMQETQT